MVGPLGYADYRRLLPGGASLAVLVDLVRNYVEDGLSWDLRLVLDRAEVPPLRLGQAGAGELGWTCWSGERPPDAGDADDLGLDALYHTVTPYHPSTRSAP